MMLHSRRVRLAVLAVLSCFTLPESTAFQVGGATFRFGRGHSSRRHLSKMRSSQLSMYLNDNDESRFALTLSSPLLASSASSVFPAFVASSTQPSDIPIPLALTYNPLLEAEVFSDAAHLALDFASIFGPTTVVVRLAAVIGRIFAIASDYLPDHAMFPEELIFQLSMLCLSGTLLLKSALPLALSSSTELSFQDRRTFCSLFGPFGVKWHQYKTLAAVMALDWVTVEAGQNVTVDEQDTKDNNDSNSCMYWLYSGDVAVLSSNGKVVHNVTRSNGVVSASNAARGLMGEMHFVRSLEKAQSETDVPDRAYPKTIIKAGTNGAKLLRINTRKLTSLMENDEQLAKAIRSLVVKSMQDKLSSFLEA